MIGGHYASADLGHAFHGYVAGGPADDHEGTRLEDGIARVRQGMKAMLRLGSAWYDVASQVKAITEQGLDSRNFILCTDDSHSGTLVDDGHMDRVVRHAIAQGLRPITAIQMATLNTATHFGLEREIGSITPGRLADMILTSDLVTLPIELVIAGGEVVAENGRITIDIPAYPYPDFAMDTVKLGKALQAADFDIPASDDSGDGDGAGHRRGREPGSDACAGAPTGCARRSGADGPGSGCVSDCAGRTPPGDRRSDQRLRQWLRL